MCTCAFQDEIDINMLGRTELNGSHDKSINDLSLDPPKPNVIRIVTL